MATTLLDKLTKPKMDVRTWQILCIARAIVLRNPIASSSDEASIVRALCACELWGLNEWFSLAPRSVGLVRGELTQMVSLIRQGML